MRHSSTASWLYKASNSFWEIKSYHQATCLYIKSFLANFSCNQQIQLRKQLGQRIIPILYTENLLESVVNKVALSITSPDRNFSRMIFMALRDALFSPELIPTRKSHFQEARNSRFCSMYDKDLAVTILLTKTIHFIFGCNLKCHREGLVRNIGTKHKYIQFTVCCFWK